MGIFDSQNEDDERLRNLIFYKMPMTNAEMEASGPVAFCALVIVAVAIFTVVVKCL